MKRINLTILTVFILVFTLSINTINCSAAVPYFTDLIEADLCTQEAMDMYDYFLSSDIVASYLDEINSYKYVVAFCDARDARSMSLRFYCFNEDIVMYKYSVDGGGALGALSKAENIPNKHFVFEASNTLLNPDGSLQVRLNGATEYTYTDTLTFEGVVYSKSPHYWGVCGTFGVVRCDVPIYQNDTEAISALNGNDIRPLYASVVNYDGDNLYFKDFRVIPHTSNDYRKFYFDVYYELSDYALANKDTLNLRFDNIYSIDYEMLSGAYNKQYSGGTQSNSIGFIEGRNSFRLYLNNINSVYSLCGDDYASYQAVLGYETIIDANKFGLGDNVIEIKGSKLYVQFYLRCVIDGKTVQSKRNDYVYDFLANSSDYSIWAPTTDVAINGEFDYTQDGNTITSNKYYYNEVTTTETGDNVNKYYFVDNGTKTEITENEYNENKYSFDVDVGGGDSGGGGGSSSAEGGGAIANATVGDVIVNVGSGTGDYVDISPKDYKFFVDNVKDMLEELDTKGGLFLLLKDIYGLFPASIWLIVGGGLSSVVIVSIVKILRG